MGRKGKIQQFYYCRQLLEFGCMDECALKQSGISAYLKGYEEQDSLRPFLLPLTKTVSLKSFCIMYVSPLHTAYCFDREISQIIRFFETQNQSTVIFTKNILISSSSRLGCAKRYCYVLEAIAIVLDQDTS